jgi:hypothetical protein
MFNTADTKTDPEPVLSTSYPQSVSLKSGLHWIQGIALVLLSHIAIGRGVQAPLSALLYELLKKICSMKVRQNLFITCLISKVSAWSNSEISLLSWFHDLCPFLSAWKCMPEQPGTFIFRTTLLSEIHLNYITPSSWSSRWTSSNQNSVSIPCLLCRSQMPSPSYILNFTRT